MLQPSDPFFLSIKKQILCGFEYNYKTVNRYRWLREFDSRALSDEVEAVNDPLRRKPLSGLRRDQLLGVCRMTATLEGLRFNFQKGLIINDKTLPKCVHLLLKSGTIVLRFSNLSSVCCPVLAFVLSCKESLVKEMDLSFNSIADQGMKILAPGLSHQDCRLMILRLSACELTSSACEYLGKALKLFITLKELDLSYNSIGDEGMKHLASGLESLMCQLETLKLSQCNIKRKGVYHLGSALQINPGVLKWLDLSMNKIGNKGAQELFTKFDISSLNTLYLYCCGLSADSCAVLGAALQDDESNLVSLNLSSNNLKDEGVQFICGGLFAGSRLQKLNLSRCGLTKLSCFYLSKVLSSITTMFSEDKQMFWQTSELKEINLSRNKLSDDGGVLLSSGLGNPTSALERLDLTECFLSSGFCLELANQLASSECHVQELDLTNNCIQDRGLKQLCAALKNPQCALKKLVLRNCGLTSKCVPFLFTALKPNVNLKELYLLGNRLDDTAKKVMVGMTKNNSYKLETIDVEID
uniref:Uncharacterized protein n=1 Tax=Knipowitschia caucasica TaxID=637954 RepID=A0AAV2LPJ4_KNICA